MPVKKVLMSHDGGVDDYLSVILLLTMPDIQTLGIVVTPADCYIEPAVSATRKILDLMGHSEIPVAQSTVRGLNPFPRIYRKDSFSIDNFPILNTRDVINTRLASQSGQQFVVDVLRRADEPVTFLETGPLTTLATALKIDPDISRKIKEVAWMGGALEVSGNVSPHLDANIDGTMEWNVYWDPPAAHQVWQTDIPIVMFPLDITNQVPLTKAFMAQLGRQHSYQLSDLAGQCYALVRHQTYYFWDVLTTAYVGRPGLFELGEWEVEIVPNGPSQGRTRLTRGGKKVRAPTRVDLNGFYEYIYTQWAR